MLNFIMDEAAATTETGWFSQYGSIIFLVLMIVVFYFFLIRPQKKQEKEFNNMLNSLAPGDEITTKGGIIGKVISIKEETMVIETSKDRTKIRLLRSAVAKIDVKADAEEAEETKTTKEVKEAKATKASKEAKESKEAK